MAKKNKIVKLSKEEKKVLKAHENDLKEIQKAEEKALEEIHEAEMDTLRNDTIAEAAGETTTAAQVEIAPAAAPAEEAPAEPVVETLPAPVEEEPAADEFEFRAIGGDDPMTDAIVDDPVFVEEDPATSFERIEPQPEAEPEADYGSINVDDANNTYTQDNFYYIT